MRGYLLPCVLSGFITLLHAPVAQAVYSLDHIVISAAGGEVASGLLSLEFTLGETAVGSGGAGQISVECGYLEGAPPTVGVEAENQTLPLEFSLGQGEPNPFSNSMRIGYAIPKGQDVPVFVGVYDIRGSLIRTLVREPQGPALHSVTWDGRRDDGAGARAGVYFVKLQAGSFVRSQRIVLLR